MRFEVKAFCLLIIILKLLIMTYCWTFIVSMLEMGFHRERESHHHCLLMLLHHPAAGDYKLDPSADWRETLVCRPQLRNTEIHLKPDKVT